MSLIYIVLFQKLVYITGFALVSSPQFHIWILWKHLDQYHQALAFCYFLKIFINYAHHLRYIETVPKACLLKKIKNKIKYWFENTEVREEEFRVVFCCSFTLHSFKVCPAMQLLILLDTD